MNDTIEVMARGMQQANAIAKLRDDPWDGIDEREREHWRFLAKAGELAVTAFLHANTREQQSRLADFHN